MPITNPAAIAFSTAYSTDKIIGIFTGSVSLSAPSAVAGNVYTEALNLHNFGDTCETQLVYNTGGVDNDQDMTVPRLTGANPVFQTLDVTSYSTSTGIVVATNNFYDNIAGAGFTYTVNYKVYCIAKKNQGIIAPIATSQTIRYRSGENYQKIYLQDIIPISVPAGTSSYSVTQTTGRVLRSRASIEYLSSGQLWGISPNQYLASGGGTANNPITTKTRLSTNSVTFDFSNSTANPISINLHYRIYLDD